MLLEGFMPNKVIILCILKACISIRAIGQGRLIHKQIIQSGLESDIVIGNTLVDMYVKCKSFSEAHSVFDKLKSRDVVSWGAIVSGYVRQGHSFQALELLKVMQQEGIQPNGVMLNIRLDIHAKCGSLEEARKVFEELPTPDVVSWGTMISACIQHEQGLLALQLYERMQQEGAPANKVIFSCILNACTTIKGLEKGRLIHGQIVIDGHESDVIVGNSLIDMYSKCGSLEDARNVFDKLLNRNLLSWGVMITSYAQHGCGLPALGLFEQMQSVGVKPNNFLFSCTLKACGNILAIVQGRLLHEQIIEIGLESDDVVGSTLVDMYAKCGILDEAHKVFNGLSNQDLISWGTMIAGYARSGKFCMAGQCLNDMRQQGLVPDDVLLTSILSAWSRAGVLEKGHQFFTSMLKEPGITPNIVHYNCMVDLLGRAGCLKDAEDMLQTMPIPSDVFGWMSLLTGCRMYGNMGLGNRCFDKILQFDPEYASSYMFMSSIYVDAHMWEAADKMQELRKFAVALKKPGRSWIEVDSQVQELIVGDKSHPCSYDMDAKLGKLTRLMKEEGYVARLDLVT